MNPVLTSYNISATNSTNLSWETITQVVTDIVSANWTTGSYISPITGSESIIWVNELNNFYACNTIRITESSDGLSWATVYNNANTIRTITWSPQLNLLVAGGDSRIVTSPDGSSWTTRTVPGGFTADFYDSIWIPELGLFVLTNDGNDDKYVVTSPDGITWTSRSLTSLTPTIDNDGTIVWSKSLGKILFGGGSTTAYLTSTDAITWTSVSTKTVANGIVWSDYLELFCVVNNNDSTTQISSDGVTWTTSTSSNSAETVIWSNPYKVFMSCSTSGSVQTSPNGLDWTVLNNLGPASVASKLFLTYSLERNVFAFGGDTPSITAYTTPDGVYIGRPAELTVLFDGHNLNIGQNAYLINVGNSSVSSFNVNGNLIYVQGSVTIEEVKDNGTNAGGAAATTWNIRQLNLITSLYGNIDVSIDSSSFTFFLGPGTYYVYAKAPAYRVNPHRIRLQNITDATTLLVGSSEWSEINNVFTQTDSTIQDSMTLTDYKEFLLLHYTQLALATLGLGIQTGAGAGINEVYAAITVWKI